MEINGLPKDLKTWAIYHNAIKFGKRNSHEQIFTELILKYYIELKENIPVKFIAFSEQYFPKYLWRNPNFANPKEMLILECNLNSFIFTKKHEYEMDISDEDLNKAFEFGEIATRFCIQYLGYSLIGYCGGKAIVTAQDQCDKKFDYFLSKGEEYWLHRIPKVYYVPSKYDLYGYFKELPVLPTNNLYYGNDEYIQSTNHSFQKVLKNRNSI